MFDGMGQDSRLHLSDEQMGLFEDMIQRKTQNQDWVLVRDSQDPKMVQIWAASPKRKSIRWRKNS